MTNINLTKVLLYSALLFSAATPAHANAGTALVYAQMTHIVILNFAIALFEALIAFFLLRMPKVRETLFGVTADSHGVAVSQLRFTKTYSILLTGNIVSAGFGFFAVLFSGPFIKLDWIPFRYLGVALFVLMLITFIFTVLIEWAFTMDLVQKSALVFRKPRRAGFMLSVVMNIISYIGLVIFYCSVADISLVTQAKYNADASFMHGQPGHIYYVEGSGYDVYRMNLDGSQNQPLGFKANSLKVVRDNKAGYMNIITDTGFLVKQTTKDKLTDIVYRSDRRAFELEKISDIGRMHSIVDYRDRTNALYDIKRNSMYYSGIIVQDRKTYRQWTIGLEMQFFQAITSNITVLPGEKIVWSYGNRILGYDLQTREVSQLARGKYPVVTLD